MLHLRSAQALVKRTRLKNQTFFHFITPTAIEKLQAVGEVRFGFNFETV